MPFVDKPGGRLTYLSAFERAGVGFLRWRWHALIGYAIQVTGPRQSFRSRWKTIEAPDDYLRLCAWSCRIKDGRR